MSSPQSKPGLIGRALSALPGVALSATIAVAAMLVARCTWLAANGLSALTLAVVIGIGIGNTVFGRMARISACGVSFTKQHLLRTGIVLYGLRLTLIDVAQVGWAGVLVDALTLCSTFALAWLLGTRLFGLDRVSAILIGAGSAICGAAAVLATEPVVRGRTEQVSVAIATVVVFGTVGIFLYPALYSVAAYWAPASADARVFGIYIGSTVHEVAQVVAAGRAIGGSTADAAVITKMVRVMMLAPFLIALSAYLARAPQPVEPISAAVPQTPPRVAVPWFALLFVTMVLVNSTGLITPATRSSGIAIDTFLLAMAMGALGLTTQVRAMPEAGLRPLLLAAMLFLWLVLGGAAINALVAHALR